MNDRNFGKRMINGIKRAAAVLLVAVLLLPAFTPVSARREKEQKVVRVGWFESPFNQTDDYGRRTGYAYEYQQKIAALSGWTYEYISGSWPNLLQMLIEGKIDLLADVSYTEERSEQVLFSSLSMGLEEYYLFVAPDNREVTYENLSTLNGKRVGINKGSIQVDLFKSWAKANGVNAEIVEVKYNESETLRRLQHGDIDAYVSLDGYYDANEATPVCRIGASDFYFAINKARPDLVEEINSAMNRMQTEDPFYNQRLNAKYIKKASVNLFLSAEEIEWLKDRGTIRVGYQDNYLAFCAKDPKTGELTGALKDYLNIAANCLENARLDFEAIAYPTAAAAMEALTRGEVDCMFPANLTDYDGETQGYLMTHPMMRTDISAIVLDSVKNTVLNKSHVTVAVNAGNPNYNMFLVDNFPHWRPIIFKDTPECLKAISEGKADCILMSNYRFNNVSKLCKKYGLVAISTGVEMDYSFAVRRDNTLLYSILNKVADVIPESSISAALSYYYTEDAKLTFGEMIMQNIISVVSLFIVIVLVILILINFNVSARGKANESRELITATETDPLTGLYSKNFFYEYAARMYRENPEKPMDVIVLNIDQFHSVNAIHGWEFGDNLVRMLGDAIYAFVSECGGIAGHSEADRFAIYCPHLESYNGLFDRLQGIIDSFSPGSGIWIRMGVMPWESGIYPRQQTEQALIACNLARGQHTGRIVVFDGHVREREDYKQRLKNDLSRALSDHELKVYYQPKYDIRTESPVLKSLEALVRWQHPELGLIPPGDFIPLFEQDGQIRKIDRYVWNETCRQIASWKSKYGSVIPVSVNLSRVDIYDPDLVETLDSMLKRNGLDKSDLMLEVTESAYAEDLDNMMRVIDGLCKKGYDIEMDDFGTGYSSLNMLSLMSLNALKMDRGFIKNICKSEKDYQIVKVILDIAKTLNIPVIAEGVETEEQLKVLKELGCDMVQGFYFSRPMPADDFERMYLIKDKD